MTAQVGVLVNARAHAIDLEAVRQIAGARIVVTSEASQVRDALHSLGALDVVAVVGGDGTASSVASALCDLHAASGVRLPAFAPIGGGTMNTVAKNFGVPARARPLENLRRLLSRPLATRDQLVLRVNEIHGFLFGAAMGARFLEAYYRASTPGPLSALSLAATTAVSCAIGGAHARALFDPVPLELDLDGEALDEPRSARLICAGSIEDVGLGIRLLPQARASAKSFQLIASSLATPTLALQLPSLFWGGRLRGTPHFDWVGQRAELRFSRAEPYTLDGELYTSDRVLIEAGPILRVPVWS